MKSEKKECIFALAISVIGIIIAYSITTLLGIKNVVLYESLSSLGTITYEVLIWFAIVFPAALIYEIAQKKEQG